MLLHKDLRVLQVPPDVRICYRLTAEKESNQRNRRSKSYMKRAPYSSCRCRSFRSFRSYSYACYGAHDFLAAYKQRWPPRPIPPASAAYPDSKPHLMTQQVYFLALISLSYRSVTFIWQ